MVDLASRYLNTITGLQFFQLMRYGTQMLIAVVLVKLNFSKAEIGQYETFLLISGFFSFFWVSGFINALLAIFKAQTQNDRKVLIFNMLLLLIAVNTMVVMVLYIFSPSLDSFTQGTTSTSYMNYILLFMFLNNPGFLVEYIYLLFDRPKSMVIYAISIFSLLLVCVLVPVLLNLGMEGLFQGLIVFAILKLLWLIVVVLRFSKFEYNLQQIKELAMVGLPIVMSIFLSGSAEYIDGWIVKYFYGDEPFTIFRYGARELPIVVLLANAFSIATIPIVAQDLKLGLNTLKKRSAKMMHWLFPLSIILLLTSEWLFIHVFDAGFKESARIFNVYILLIISRLIFPQTILTGMKKTGFLTISSFIELTINVLLSIFLIHRFGLIGVAYATLIAFAFDKIFLVFVNYHYFQLKPTKYIPFKVYLPYLVLTIIVFCYLQW